MTPIIVIGSGVSGLSSAFQLQQAGFEVSIISRDRPQNTTSIAAGAFWSGRKAQDRARQWAQITLDHFLALAQQADSGVAVRRLREFFPHDVPDPWYQDQLPYFQRIPPSDLPANSQAGFVMDVPIVEPPRYLKFLHDRFIANGGTVEIRSIQRLDELRHAAPLLVNCSGAWARQVAADPAVYPIRGQSVVLDAPDITQGYMNDHSFTYLFPRGDGLLVGGIAEPHIWDMEINPRQTAEIIARCSQIEPSIAQARVLQQFVGLRPGRERVRLEAESLAENCTVIHNYGHASIGYTLSWGCARDVRLLAQNLLHR